MPLSPCIESSVITVRTGDLAPDDADLGAADLLLATVDESDLLAEVEAITNCQYPDRLKKFPVSV